MADKVYEEFDNKFYDSDDTEEEEDKRHALEDKIMDDIEKKNYSIITDPDGNKNLFMIAKLHIPVPDEWEDKDCVSEDKIKDDHEIDGI